MHDEKDYTKTSIVFECEAELITEADKLYQEKFGKDPTKNKNIGCVIKFTH